MLQRQSFARQVIDAGLPGLYIHHAYAPVFIDFAR
jgi:hypothetical protein